MPSSASDEAPFSASRQSWWRKRLLLAGLLLLLVLCLGGPYLYLAMVAESDLRKAIAEADRTDPGWRLLELEAQRAVIPPAQNSAVHLMNAKALVSSQWPFWKYPFAPENRDQRREDLIIFDESFDKLEPEAQLGDRQVAALRKELRRAAAALEELYKIVDKPRGRFPITYPKDFISYFPSHTEDTRALADLLLYDVVLRCQDQNTDGALTSCHCLIHAQRAIGDEPNIVSTLARFAIRSHACKKIERILAQGQPSKAALTAMQRLLEVEAVEPLYLIGTRGDRAHMDAYLAALQSGDASVQNLRKAFDLRQDQQLAVMEDLQFQIFPGAAKINRAALLQYKNHVVEFAKLSIEEQRPLLTATEPSAKNLPWPAQLLAQAWRKIALAFHRNVAEIRCTVALLASERYRRDHKQWPRSLDDLVPRYLGKIPSDPFADAPLRLRPTKDGIVIYSVGYDGKDDGGNLASNGVKPGTDLGFRLWAPEKRRQPSR